MKPTVQTNIYALIISWIAVALCGCSSYSAIIADTANFPAALPDAVYSVHGPDTVRNQETAMYFRVICCDFWLTHAAIVADAKKDHNDFVFSVLADDAGQPGVLLGKTSSVAFPSPNNGTAVGYLNPEIKLKQGESYWLLASPDHPEALGDWYVESGATFGRVAYRPASGGDWVVRDAKSVPAYQITGRPILSP